LEHFDVVIRWDETEGEPAMWISECDSLGVFLCQPTISKLIKQNWLACEDMREVSGKSTDFTLNFKIETPQVREFVVV
jgi:hypothetical protein